MGASPDAHSNNLQLEERASAPRLPSANASRRGPTRKSASLRPSELSRRTPKVHTSSLSTFSSRAPSCSMTPTMTWNWCSRQRSRNCSNVSPWLTPGYNGSSRSSKVSFRQSWDINRMEPSNVHIVIYTTIFTHDGPFSMFNTYGARFQ